MTDLSTLAHSAKAWPFELARKLEQRVEQQIKAGQREAGDPVTFETGYGPSGLPHIGTFNEVLRTTMVRRAFETMSDIPTRLIAFSDDMDGLRKVPDNVPNKAMLTEHLGKPLTRIPDPFEKYDSFAAHNNAMLREFLDRFGFDYEFASSTEYYEGGKFDEALKNVLRNFSGIMDVMLPTLRKERQATYSPVLPVSPKSGIVLQVPIDDSTWEFSMDDWMYLQPDGRILNRTSMRKLGLEAASITLAFQRCPCDSPASEPL